jgi:hypothetical protein
MQVFSLSSIRQTVVFVSFVVAAVCSPSQPAHAEEDRFSRLTGSSLFKRMEALGDWEIAVLPEAVEYSCLTCKGSVVARLEIVAPYAPGAHRSVRQRYLAERRQFCADLVALRQGRCVSFKKTRWNIVLRGFVSEHETASESVTEIVLFYWEYGLEREKIMTTIRAEKGANVPRQSSPPFMAHMARLTFLF